MPPLVSIVLPVHNQADHIERIGIDCLRALQSVDFEYEILLVVNGSQDASFDVCKTLTRRFSEVRALNLEAGGWGLAVKTGLRAAQGDLLCYANSARTSAGDLALLLRYGSRNADKVIKANRKIRESAFRRVGSLLYNLECRILFDLPYWDINGTPKVFPRSFKQLSELTQDGDLIDLEFSVICRRYRYPMLEVPILSSCRHGGKSTTRLKSALHLYLGAYKMWVQSRKGGK